ncbi:hypothetical protein C8A03DRAFT_41481 [Achaetomium macrosporum]|uniref:Uncharacterized protein n=1 Tax=Achaetomium macrosporum TaxID=79813 RepID=A0AAN7HDM5_9PEZI|nr:hypothetical protein C8A03DRAFT_41481 [Achaetomium macrosporum]
MESILPSPTTPSSISTHSASTAPASVALEELCGNGGAPTIQFTNPEDLIQNIKNVNVSGDHDCLIVKDVSPTDFTEIESKVGGVRFHYFGHLSLLIVTIPTQRHEYLHRQLYDIVRDRMRQQGKDPNRDFWPVGSGRFSVGGNHPGRGAGEGDSAGKPLPELEWEDAWPTLVIEAGYSMSLAQLRAIMRWWFSASDHQVKIVIVVKLLDNQQQIIVQKWEEELPQAPYGMITRSQAAVLQQQPALQQEITINRDSTTTPPSYQVTRGALILGFRQLFLQEPGPDNGDIVISVEDLQGYADYFWRVRLGTPG